MKIQATAPGKLVLCGEYAVLEGAPALVLAVGVYARVTLEEASDGAFHVAAPDVDVADARFEFDGRGRVRWGNLDDVQQRRLSLVTRIIEAFGVKQTPFRALLDTSGFSSGGAKLGLGSSAALTVALAAALRARGENEPPKVEDLIPLHRGWQGGGSGVDVAAGCNGGLSIYRLRNDKPTIERAHWPASLHACCIWSGQAAETGAQLRRLSDWRMRAPRPYAHSMRELAQEAEGAVAAVRNNDVVGLLRYIAAYAQRLRQFGAAAGLNIFTEGHHALSALAGRHGVVYKPCGAGGDIGIGLSTDEKRLNEFRRESESLGFREIALRRPDRGLQVSREFLPSTQQALDDHAGRYVATTC